MQIGLTDQALIQQVLTGDQFAYKELISKYQDYVFTLTFRLVQQREEAEELAQDVFVKAYRALADFRGESKFSTWLYTIARTTCITHLRKKRPNMASLDNEHVNLKLQDQPGGYEADRVESKSRLALLDQAIKLLQADDAQIITLFYKAEQSLEEIASIFGIEVNTAKVRLHRARRKLKETLEMNLSTEELNSLKS